MTSLKSLEVDWRISRMPLRNVLDKEADRGCH